MYPDGGLFPSWMWTVMTDLGFFVAVVAVISALAWLWKHGPRLLIENGPNLFTNLGKRWEQKRNGDSEPPTS